MITGKAEKFSRILYKTLLDDEISGIKQYKWISCIKNILQSTGKNDICTLVHVTALEVIATAWRMLNFALE